jgi:tetratricopeptide (TPR) repeat protein
MKRLMLLIFFVGVPAFADEATTVFERVRDSVVSVVAFDEQGESDVEGSAVVTGTDQVVTNCHVITEASAIKIKARDKILIAKLQHADQSRDLCSLTVLGLEASVVKGRNYRDLKIGERVYAVGNPLGFELSVSAGLISFLGDARGEPRIVTTVALSPGSSGGGLFDAEGRLIGITTAVFHYGQNTNLALPTDWIVELPKRAKPLSAMSINLRPDTNWLEEAEALRIGQKWNELLALANNWRKTYPTSADALTYAGLALFNHKKFSDARDILAKTTREHPRNASARGYLGLARDELGEKQLAQSDLKVAIALQPSSGFFRFALALIYRNAGRFDSAQTMITEAIRLEPGEARYWAALGDIHTQQKRLAPAVQAYQTALRLDPTMGAARSNLAAAQAMLGQSGDAKQTLGTSANPNEDANTWLKIGAAEEQKNRLGEAEKAYRKALELAPKSAETWHRLGGCLIRTNRKTDAEKAFRTAISFEPRASSSWWALGDILQSRGDTQLALDAYQKATSFEPKLAGAWRSLAYLMRDKRDLPAMVDALQKVVQLEPDSANDWPLLGDGLVKLQRMDEARLALDRAEKLAPNNVVTLQGLATYHGMRGDHPKAIGYMDRALEIDGADAASWSNKGYSLLKLQRYKESVDALQTAVSLQPDFANAWINLGEANLRSKQLSRAITALEKACQLAPNAVDARLYISQAYLGSGQAGKAKQHLDILIQRQPNLPAAWYMLALTQLAQGDQKEMVTAYTRLKTLQPALAGEFKEKLRIHPTYRNLSLPD